MPFRGKGLTTALQIENYEGERNPFYHTAQDTIANMNIEYWSEQLKATTAIAVQLAGPIPLER
jgi:hypothetical protein